MQNIRSTLARGRTFERFFASLALIVCFVTVVRLWQIIGAYQPLWLFPALYFLEMGAVSVLAWFALAITPQLSSRQIALAWGCVGVLMGFVILGMWSVGFFFIPTAALFAVTALFAERRHVRLIPAQLGIAILAMFTQMALMFLVIALQLSLLKI